MADFWRTWSPLIYSIGIVIGAGIIGTITHVIVFRILSRTSRRTTMPIDDALIKYTRRPLKHLMILLAINITLPLLEISSGLLYIFNSVFRSLFIISVAWLIIGLTAVGEVIVLSRYDIAAKDNLKARAIYTQTQTIRKILGAIVVTVAVALILMGFDSFRQLGTGILASAGIASVVIGLAAQKIFGNFLAGIQIAFTQPIRIDDVVIVENEWGKIEEITLTYVVVRIWDLRRLVLPISYFIEKPFQN
ncbi:MAG: mechanosensitive ion channel, partial [Dehalococcoidales bacterium]|nr:mechanosensitive ion channel [Dehalococcoidales bacterium]